MAANDIFLSYTTWASHHVYAVGVGIGIGVALAIALLHGPGRGWRQAAVLSTVAFVAAAILSIVTLTGILHGGYIKNSGQSASAGRPADSRSAKVSAVAMTPSIPPAAAQPN